MDRSTYMKAYNEAYRRSIKGLVKAIWKHQLRNCKQRNHPVPEYTYDELFAYCTSSVNFNTLYSNWVNSSYDKELTPSVNRLDNSKTYSFDNIEIITWKENKQKAYTDIRNNVLHNPTLLNGGHKPVCQYSLEGVKLNTYISVSDAARNINGIHQAISDCCKGTRPTYKKFLWCYLENEDKFLSNLSVDTLEKTKKSALDKTPWTIIVQYNSGGEEEMSVQQAAALLGVSNYLIRKYAKTQSTININNVVSLRKKHE